MIKRPLATAKHPLDHPVWNALTSHHASLALGAPPALRYDPAFATFAALAEPSAGAFEALASALPTGARAALVTRRDVAPTAAFDCELRRDVLQMAAVRKIAGPLRDGLVTLGAADVPEMLALIEQTQPGPFYARSVELGRFLGVRVEGRLAAITGERMRLRGHTEVSAVCVDPAFRGQGLARDLIIAVARGIETRGETPFLHVYADNHAAIALYRQLGFADRAMMRITVLLKR